METENAAGKAIDDMPDSFLIRTYLLANRSEVRNMCITEYNEAETMQMLKEEAEEKLGKLISLLLADDMPEEAKRPLLIRMQGNKCTGNME